MQQCRSTGAMIGKLITVQNVQNLARFLEIFGRYFHEICMTRLPNEQLAESRQEISRNFRFILSRDLHTARLRHISIRNRWNVTWPTGRPGSRPTRFNAETKEMALLWETDWLRHRQHRPRRTTGTTAECSREYDAASSPEPMMRSTAAAKVSRSSPPGAWRPCRETPNYLGWHRRRRNACPDGTGCESWRWATEIWTCASCSRDYRLENQQKIVSTSPLHYSATTTFPSSRTSPVSQYQNVSILDFTETCKTWSTPKLQGSRIDAFDMWALRKILRIPYARHVTNVEVRATTGCHPHSHLVTDRRLRLFGPIACSSPQHDHHRAVAAVIRGLHPYWKRPLGRPSHTWLRAVEADLGQQNIGLASAWRKAAIRDDWRRIVDTTTLQRSML